MPAQRHSTSAQNTRRDSKTYRQFHSGTPGGRAGRSGGWLGVETTGLHPTAPVLKSPGRPTTQNKLAPCGIAAYCIGHWAKPRRLHSTS
uniref:Uncharacterized protein n=1 Tax=Knipowitschia caucasica TaxID=637954 RepID=A0AAV2KW29_KNICA